MVYVSFLITIQKVVGTLNIILDFINNTYVIVSKKYLGTLNIILEIFWFYLFCSVAYDDERKIMIRVSADLGLW